MIREPVAVQVGGYPDDDACLAVGRVAPVHGSKLKLEVRDRPDDKGRIVASIPADSYVWMCDVSANGEWTGILFSHRPDGRISCGVSGTIPEREDYDGPCRQGWVPQDTIILYAG